MVLLERFIIVVLVSAALSIITKKANVLNNSGVASAFIIGVCIGTFGGIEWLVLLLMFLISGFGATIHSFEKKKALGVQEGKKGERGWKNSWSTGLVPTLAAIMVYVDHPVFPERWAGVVFASALAAAASDTFASEMGMLYSDPVLITSPRTRVQVGTNGGITLKGTMWAFAASLFMGVCAYILLSMGSDSIPPSPGWMLIVAVMGFAGCQFDSILGALFENRNRLSKHGVNLISISLASLLAGIMAWLVIG